jgi:hypothetical protein
VPALLSIPDLDWRNGALFSRAHDDCYTPAVAQNLFSRELFQ